MILSLTATSLAPNSHTG